MHGSYFSTKHFFSNPLEGKPFLLISVPTQQAVHNSTNAKEPLNICPSKIIVFSTFWTLLFFNLL